ncbi:MAG: hypothetical protein ACREGB_00655 [Candidatus Saccharimonadales bacterium]
MKTAARAVFGELKIISVVLLAQNVVLDVPSSYTFVLLPHVEPE